MPAKSWSRFIFLAVIAASLAGLIGQSTAAAGGWQLLALEGGFWNGGQLYYADAKGRLNFIGNVATKHPHVEAMAYSQGYVWIVAGNDTLSSPNNTVELYKVSVGQMRSGAQAKGDLATWVRTIPDDGDTNPTEMFSNPAKAGKFYIYDGDEDEFDHFRKKKGGLKGFNGNCQGTGSAIAMAPNGKIWGTDSTELYRLSRTGDCRRSWTMNFPPGAGSFPRINGMDFHPDSGELIGFLNGAWSGSNGGQSGLVRIDMSSANRGNTSRYGPVVSQKIESLTYIPA